MNTFYWLNNKFYTINDENNHYWLLHCDFEIVKFNIFQHGSIS